MDLASQKKLNHRRARKKRLGCGRGTGLGKTCGKGHKGAKCRSGWTSKNMTGGQMPLFRRLPKRGFNNAKFGKVYSVVNIEQIVQFDADTEITPELLHQSGMIKRVEQGGVKVLGVGTIDKPLKLRVHAVSKSAREKIEAAGGTIDIIQPPAPFKRNKMKGAPVELHLPETGEE